MQPCNNLECPRYSECLGDDNDDWKCSCIRGFEMHDSQCVDIGLILFFTFTKCKYFLDECQWEDVCSETSKCKNTLGTFVCNCRQVRDIISR